ncbi:MULTISPECIES: hypothetical protein [unclassified Streptomyces]|uniref:hypothetical protein n=1 Tax=unclassified Streptomyces TaxID=2593676 RepID=UPI000373D132|nr:MULTISPECIES: hypothetical protein [unclassified Streptomyces]MYX30012.1 hypothetical protein [Streptomyces sp. SID8381]
MPTPYGTRGGIAFGAEELRVLRRALAVALHLRPARAEDLQDCLRLAESLDEAMREGARLRAFLLADLARYRAALPGTAVGYFALLREALDAGHRPGPDDLAALRALRGNPTAAALLRRCGAWTGGPSVPASRSPLRPAPASDAARTPVRAPVRSPLAVLPAARAGRSGGEPAKKPAPKPAERPARPAPAPPGPAPAPGGPQPGRRPVPTPGEVFPRRKPSPPAGEPQQRLAAV